MLEAGDTLMVTKLDRLARSANEGAQLIKSLTDKGIKVLRVKSSQNKSNFS